MRPANVATKSVWSVFPTRNKFLKFQLEWDKARYNIKGWPAGVDEEALENEYLREISIDSERAEGSKR